MTPRRLAVARAHEVTEDGAALARVAKGDVGALGEIFDRHSRALLRFVSRSAGTSDAEDIVQTTFVRAAKVAATYDARGDSARPWLFGIAVRVLQERRRAFARLGRALSRLDASRTAGPPTAARSDLEKGLFRLTEAKRVVIVLAEIEGFTCEEIAAMLETPVGTVWTRLHHARKELRSFFEEGSS